MLVRYSKILCIVAICFYCALSAFNNITAYYTTFPLVERALIMKDIFPNATIGYRAITSPFLHHGVYILIIILELLTTIFCAIGAWKLLLVRNKSAILFNQNKNWAIAGLTLGFLLWQVLFLSIGGEWFGFWMSELFRSVMTAAFHIYITFLVVLIYVAIRDDEVF